jgi:type IV pilus assembly protein PilF
MNRSHVLTFLFFVATAIAGCAGAPSGKIESAQSPVSQQAAVGDARQRAKAHTDLGMVYLREGRLNVALDEARIAIESDSSYPLGYNLLGLVRMYLKENQAADESFATALRLAPGDPEVNNNYGWFLCQTGRERQSFQYFDTASQSQLYATPTIPLTNAGICALGIRDDRAAESFLLRAMRVDPANAEAQFMLATICHRTGRLSEARMRLAEVLRMTEPTAQTSWLGLRIERKLGDREAEARYASQLRRKFQDSVEYRLLMQGKFDE